MGATRRGFIKILGSSALILAPVGGFAITRTPAEALAPWKLAGGNHYADRRVRALSYAILAPNPHNRQPWIADLSEPGVTLYCDPDRLLPETDPYNRQITIGLGCFLELLRMAAADEGYRADITPFPQGSDDMRLDERPVAHIRFVKDRARSDILFGQVLKRRSLKEPFDTSRIISPKILDKLRAIGDDTVDMTVVNDETHLGKLRDLTWRAHLLESMTPRTMQESIDLMRIGKSEINANPDGIDLGGFFLEALAMSGELTREKLADQNSKAFKQGLDMYKAMMDSAMGYVWVTTPSNTRIDQLNAGRNWVRLNLRATSVDLGIHPLSQALQEYSEMDDLYVEIHDELGVGVQSDARIQMFGRLGYGPRAAPTPRWNIDTRVRGS
jgi:hypothetical protein